MFHSIKNALHLIKAAATLARYDALVPHEFATSIPLSVRMGAKLARLWPVPNSPRDKDLKDARPGQRLASALTTLGPTYIKLGQFLATRPDIIGAELADDLKQLQDDLPPFSNELAKTMVAQELGHSAATLFSDFGPPLAAASIAQVHKARLKGSDQAVAVKILRPDIEAIFERELEAFAWGARLLERIKPELKRLEPVKLVNTLRESVTLEMDLRLEAAAASEMAERNQDRDIFVVPNVDWQHTSQRILTSEWIDAIPLGDLEALRTQGHDLEQLAQTVVQTFLQHALFDGFFHADMHQGNLFVDMQGRLVAVDFGIMGRLDKASRRYLAEILFGFLTRNYEHLADVHFDAGYVSADQSRDAFAQSLRSVGEPIHGRPASEISMARLLAQLFQVTDVFNMHLQPQLVLLQKTMVVVEGVARDLNPQLDIWETSRPIVQQWMQDHFSPEARLRDMASTAAALGPSLAKLPETLRTAEALTSMVSEEGVRLHPESARAFAQAERERNRPYRFAAWVAALALLIIALSVFVDRL